MKFDDKKQGVEYMKQFCGEDVKVRDEGNAVYFLMPTKESLISAMKGEDDEMKFEEVYKMELTNTASATYWISSVKRHGVWTAN